MVEDPLAFVPARCRDQVAALAANVIEYAASAGRGNWGVTAYVDGFRINVGWTEIVTIYPDFVRLIVDGAGFSTAERTEGVELFRGTDPRGFYPTVPGSVLAEVSLEPAGRFQKAVSALQPALMRAVLSASRRRAGRGVQVGHRQDAVIGLSAIVGRPLPAPAHLTQERDPLGASQNPVTEGDRWSDVDAAAVEGERRLVQHFRVERNAALVRRKKALVLSRTGRLECEACGFDFGKHYGARAEGFCEVHHKLPLSAREAASETTLEDLAVVCSNCHRVLHFASCALSVENLRNELVERRTRE